MPRPALLLVALAVPFAASCAAEPPAEVRASPEDEAVLRRILADWAERRERFGRVEVVLEGEKVNARGSVPRAGWKRFEPEPEGDFPPEDYRSPFRYRAVIDFPNRRARFEREEERPGPDPAFHRGYSVALADGDRRQTYEPTERNPHLVTTPHAEIREHEAGETGELFRLPDWPVWHAVGVVGLRNTVEPEEEGRPEFRVVRREERDGRELVVLTETAGGPEYWVDPGRQSAVVRFAGEPKSWSLDVTHRETDRGWMPDRWRFEIRNPDGGASLLAMEFEVVRFTPDPDLTGERFHVEPGPGTVVYEGGRAWRWRGEGLPPVDIGEDPERRSAMDGGTPGRSRWLAE